MQRTRLLWLVAAALLLSSTLAWAAPLQDYTVAYAFKNPDGTLFRIMKYYQRDGDKFRSDHFSTVVYHISNSEMKAEQLKNVEADIVTILRKDKDLVWSLDPPSKSYYEVPLKQDSWLTRDYSVFLPPDCGFAKTGETKVLDYPCDVYQGVAKVKEDTWTNIIAVARDLGVVLRTETRQNDKLVQTMEAIEFTLEKPAAALFEIPAEYSKKRQE